MEALLLHGDAGPLRQQVLTMLQAMHPTRDWERVPEIAWKMVLLVLMQLHSPPKSTIRSELQVPHDTSLETCLAQLSLAEKMHQVDSKDKLAKSSSSVAVSAVAADAKSGEAKSAGEEREELEHDADKPSSSSVHYLDVIVKHEARTILIELKQVASAFIYPYASPTQLRQDSMEELGKRCFKPYGSTELITIADYAKQVHEQQTSVYYQDLLSSKQHAATWINTKFQSQPERYIHVCTVIFVSGGNSFWHMETYKIATAQRTMIKAARRILPPKVPLS